MAGLISISADEEQGLRLIKLLDEATNVLRDYLLDPYKTGPATLEDDLKKEEKKLRKLLMSKEDQIQELFPLVGKTNPDNYDISLLTVLLRTIRKIPQPKTGWNAEPPTSDKSPSANIVRIQLARNTVNHSRLSKTHAEFSTCLTNIGIAMVGFGANQSIVNAIIKQPIDGNITALYNQKLAELDEANVHIQDLVDKLEELESCYDKDIWYNVPYLPVHFTGRKDEVKDLHCTLCATKTHQKLGTIITGMSGTGKTSLALFYCYEYQTYYDNIVIWLNANTKESLTDDFIALSKHLKIQENDENVQNMVTRVYKFFSDQNRDILFCFDNADEVSVVLDFLPNKLPPSAKKPYILITSRVGKWSQGFDEHPIKMLSTEESKELITTHLLKDLISNEESLNQVCAMIKGYAIVLQQSISYMNYNSIKTDEYLDEMKSINDEDLLSFPADDCAYKHNFYGLMKITLDSLKKQNAEKVIHLLHLMSFLDGLAIDQSLLLKTFTKKLDLNSCMRILERLSLIQVLRNIRTKEITIKIHSLVQTVVRHQLIREAEHIKIIREVFKMFDGLIAERLDRATHFEFGKHWLHHIIYLQRDISVEMMESSCRRHEDTIILTEINKRLEHIIPALQNVQQSELALQLINKIEKIVTEPREIASILMGKLSLLIKVRRYVDGLDLCKRIEEHVKQYNIEDLSQISLMFNKAFCLSGCARHADALELYKEIHSIELIVKGENDLDTLLTENNITYELARLKRYQDALDSLECTINKYKMCDNYEHDKNYYVALDNKGKYLLNDGRYFEALAVFREILDDRLYKKRLEIFGEKSSLVMHPKLSLSSCCYIVGHYKESLLIADEVLENVKENYENYNFNKKVFFSCLNLRGNALLRLGRYSEAHEQYCEMRLHHKDDSQAGLINELNIGITLQAMGRYNEAFTRYDIAYEGFSSTEMYSFIEHDKLRIQVNKASCLVDHGEYEQALTMITDLNKSDIFDKTDRYWMTIHTSYANCLLIMGRYSEAKQHCLEAFKLCKNVCKWHMERLKAHTIFTKCQLYERSEDLMKITTDLDCLIDESVEELGHQHPLILAVREVLYEVCIQKGEKIEAKNILEDLINMQTDVLGNDHPMTLHNRCRLLMLSFELMEQDKIDEQESYSKTLKDLQDILHTQEQLLSETHIHLFITKRNIATINILLHNQTAEVVKLLQDLKIKYKPILGKNILNM